LGPPVISRKLLELESWN